MIPAPSGSGTVRIRQPEDGYRFSMDAVVIARSVMQTAATRFLDLGTGCGIIPILAARECPTHCWVGVEIQPALAELARLNVHDNGLENRVTILTLDHRQVTPDLLPFAVEHVVANPPFRRIGHGRINPNTQRAVARHEIHGTLRDLVTTARRCLGQGGWFSVVFPMDRNAELVEVLGTIGIEPKRVQPIQTGPDRAPSRVVVHACVGASPGVVVEPPFRVDGSSDIGVDFSCGDQSNR